MTPKDFSRRWVSYFGTFEQHRLEELALGAKAALGKDDAAVADRLLGAFDILFSRLGAFTSDAEREEIVMAFERVTGLDADDAVEDCLEALLFSGDYARGEELCVKFAETRLGDGRHMLEHRAEFLVRLGRVEEAEASLIAELGRDTRDTWLYVSLGDVFYTFQPVEAIRDLEAAESWYYRGFDRGLARERGKAGHTLLRRLGQVCIDRLRRRAFGRLASAMARFGMGPNSYTQLLASVRTEGHESDMLTHLRSVASTDENGRGVELLQALDDGYRFMPQDRFDGLSSFEMDAYVPAGKHEKRIAEDMRKKLGSAGSRMDERHYLDQRDPDTRRVRRTLIQEERRKAHKQYKDGKTVWKGFLRYRETVNIEDLFKTVAKATNASRGKAAARRRRQ